MVRPDSATTMVLLVCLMLPGGPAKAQQPNCGVASAIALGYLMGVRLDANGQARLTRLLPGQTADMARVRQHGCLRRSQPIRPAKEWSDGGRSDLCT